MGKRVGTMAANLRKAEGKKINAKVERKKPTTRESKDSKEEIKHKIKAKTLKAAIDKLRYELDGSLAREENAKPEYIDPQYRLKGAARVAMEYYAPPSTKVLLDETDLFETKHGIFYSFLKGLEYLQALKDYAIYVRDVMHKVKDSIQVFEQMLQLDVTDKLNAKGQLLQCHLHCKDRSAGLTWLQSESISTFAAYGTVLLQIAEEDDKATIFEAVDSSIKVNPYVIWFLAYPDAFTEVLNLADIQTSDNSAIASLLEAVLYVQNNKVTWDSPIVGANYQDILKDYLIDRELDPPRVTAAIGGGSDEKIEVLVRCYMNGIRQLEITLTGGTEL